MYCTLVTGSRASVLLDTGTGKNDISGFIKRAADGELIVINSHGHADHIGGNGSFGAAYISAADAGMLPEALRSKTDELREGMEFDLGEETAAVSLAGHTRGSMGLLLKKSRLLLAGDALNPRLQLLGEEACGLDTLRATLIKALDMPFDNYIISHAPSPLPKLRIEAHLRHIGAMDRIPAEERMLAGQRVTVSRYLAGDQRSEFIMRPDIYERSLRFG